MHTRTHTHTHIQTVTLIHIHVIVQSPIVCVHVCYKIIIIIIILCSHYTAQMTNDITKVTWKNNKEVT